MRKRRDFNDLNQLFLNLFSCTFFNLRCLGIYNDEWTVIASIVVFYIFLLIVPFILLNLIILFRLLGSPKDSNRSKFSSIRVPTIRVSTVSEFWQNRIKFHQNGQKSLNSKIWRIMINIRKLATVDQWLRL